MLGQDYPDKGQLHTQRVTLVAYCVNSKLTKSGPECLLQPPSYSVRAELSLGHLLTVKPGHGVGVRVGFLESGLHLSDPHSRWTSFPKDSE